ncbi:MAG TPA: alpha/beta hydrolase [Candidatus Dormibacteraeota bacterium]|nr:alpha/beta hydrolase [Candidatus Dormibacteraeota bacterium]
MTSPIDGELWRDARRLHYVAWTRADRRAAQPPIVLLHGLGSNARYWDRIAAELGQWRLVALDLTPDDPEHAAMDALVDDITFAISQLDLQRPVLVGHSWGAGLALEYAVRRPATVSGIVFVDGPMDGVASIFSWDEVEAIMQPPFPRYASLEDAIAHTKAALGAAWGDDLVPFVEGGLKRVDGGLVPVLTAAVRHRLLRGLYDSNPEQLWPRLEMPATALVARKSDAKISRSTETGIERVTNIAPALRIRRFETPHDIPLYAPAGVAEEIERIARQAAVVSA